MSDEWQPSVNQRVFIATLAKMVAPMQSTEAVNAMMPMLPAVQHLPDSVFANPADLALAIGAEMDRVPSLARLRKGLVAWHDKHTPKRTALPGLEDSEMSGADRCMVGFWNEYRGGIKPLPARVTLETWLAMIRIPNAAAFQHLCRTDLVAAEIAVKRGWLREPRHGDRDPAEIAYVGARVQEALAALGGLSSTTDADHRASTVPPEALATPPEPLSHAAAPQPPAKPLGALTPAQMQAVRMANPLLRPIAEAEAAREAERRRASEAFETPPRAIAVDIAHERPLPPLEWPDEEDVSC
jgi:hypothetical protein